MARRKITKPQSVDDLANEASDDLPEITENQRAFVEGILAGKTASDAYRAAYDCSGMTPNTLWCEASKLRSHPKVSQWLSAARKAELGTAKRTLEQHIRRLESLQEVAVQSGNVGAAVQAEQLIGKASGHYVEQIRDVTEINPADTLKRIAEHAPDLAKLLAQQHGLPWTEH